MEVIAKQRMKLSAGVAISAIGMAACILIARRVQLDHEGPITLLILAAVSGLLYTVCLFPLMYMAWFPSRPNGKASSLRPALKSFYWILFAASVFVWIGFAV